MYRGGRGEVRTYPCKLEEDTEEAVDTEEEGSDVRLASSDDTDAPLRRRRRRGRRERAVLRGRRYERHCHDT